MRVFVSIVAAAGLTILPGRSASIALSSDRAGARPVDVVLTLRYTMQCGWPGPSIAVTFPAAERLPSRVATSSVLVNGKRPATVSLSGRTISIGIARPGAVMCDVIGPGTARIDFTRAAALGNPSATGTYAVAARHGPVSLRASFTIRR